MRRIIRWLRRLLPERILLVDVAADHECLRARRIELVNENAETVAIMQSVGSGSNVYLSGGAGCPGILLQADSDGARVSVMRPGSGAALILRVDGSGGLLTVHDANNKARCMMMTDDASGVAGMGIIDSDGMDSFVRRSS